MEDEFEIQTNSMGVWMVLDTQDDDQHDPKTVFGVPPAPTPIPVVQPPGAKEVLLFDTASASWVKFVRRDSVPRQDATIPWDKIFKELREIASSTSLYSPAVFLALGIFIGRGSLQFLG